MRRAAAIFILFDLIRIKSWLKNILIFIPVVFSGKLFDGNNALITLSAFVSFSFVSSSVYIMNDLRDSENDRKHPQKCTRPIAAGKICAKKALILAICLGVLGFFAVFFIGKMTGFLLWPTLELSGYFCINLGYSMGLKNFPLIDVFLLAIGFMLRVFYGASILGLDTSNWIYLTIFLEHYT